METTTLGARDVVSFDLASRGDALPELRVWVGARCVWGTNGGMQGIAEDWVQLIDHLAKVWRQVRWEDGYPLGLTPRSPSSLWNEAERALSDAADGFTAHAEERLAAFAAAHDFSSAISTARLPSLWFVRVGNLMSIASGRSQAELPIEEAIGLLERLAETILDRFPSSTKITSVRERWAARNEGETRELVKVYTRLPDDLLREIEGKRAFNDAWELGDGFEPTELMAAARATAQLPAEVRSRLLERVRLSPYTASSEIESWSRTAREAADRALKPWRQGCLAAQAIRAAHLASERDPIDIEHLLITTLKVVVEAFPIPSMDVDAFAVWGPRHGPVVLWNPAGKYSSDKKGRLATLAHELAHLLLDRDGALPLLEFLKGRTPEVHEARARAFAAELLLPQLAAKQRFDGIPYRKVRGEFRSVQKHYRVSRELAAWQISNSGAELSVDVRAFLRQFVSRPESMFDYTAPAAESHDSLRRAYDRLAAVTDDRESEFAHRAGRKAAKLLEW